MSRLFVAADDLTGALDTAVQFSKQGISTCVLPDKVSSFPDRALEAAVLVINLTSRHLAPKEAYQRVYDATRLAVAAGIPYLYKKTDSVLRGNVGAELTAMMDAAGSARLDFLPAFPALRRTTRGGVQMLDGRPIHESVFAADPFEPVTRSRVADIIAAQSDVKCAAGETDNLPEGKAICIYDAETDEDLLETAQRIYASGGLGVMAGCAGLAGVLSGIIDLTGGQAAPYVPDEKLLVVCGSMNPVAREQIAYAQEKGCCRVTLTPAECMAQEADFPELTGKILHLMRDGQTLMLDVDAKERVSPECGERIADGLGRLTAALWQKGLRATVLATGGDTLLGVLRAMKCEGITPVREMQPGVVLSRGVCMGEEIPFISKAGGFGTKSLFADIAGELSGSGKDI